MVIFLIYFLKKNKPLKIKKIATKWNKINFKSNNTLLKKNFTLLNCKSHLYWRSMI